MNYHSRELSQELLKTHLLFYQMHRMGEPIFTDRIPTAAVQFDKIGNFCNFYWNPLFYDKLSLQEKVAVLIHECLHVILNHGIRSLNIDNHKLANIVQDCVINNIIVEEFDYPQDIFDTIVQKINPLSKASTFDNVFSDPRYQKLDRSLSWEYYYNLLLENTDQKQIDDIELFDQNLTKDEYNGDEINTSSSQDEKHYQRAGNQSANQNTNLKNDNVSSSNSWYRAIRKWCAKNNTVIENQCIKTNRRICNLPKNIVLPSYNTCEEQTYKPEIFVCMDVSFSCIDLVTRFYQAIKSIPITRFSIKYFVFDTSIRRFYLQNNIISTGGGTDFNCIEELVRKKYPDHIWVITDGESYMNPPKHPDRYSFFLDGSFTTTYIPNGCNIYQLRDFYESENRSVI